MTGSERKKTVLITGASGGIGQAAAIRFAEHGHRVVLHGNQNFASAEETAHALKSRHLSALAAQADIGSESDVRRMFEAVMAHFGSVEVLVNNAGIALPQMLLTDCTAADWDRVFSVNVRGAFLCIREALPAMVAKKCGSIVNISSMWGITGGACETAYSASKAALIGLTRALAKEVAPSGIRVNCIAPGFVETRMNAALSAETVEAVRQETPLERLGTPEDIAAAIEFLALSDASFITGQVLSVDGGRCI